MTTAADLVARTQRHLYTGSREQLDILNGAYTAGGTSLTVTDGVPGIVEGGSLAIDLEIFYVRSFNAATKVATVIGAQQGSTAANHSDQATITVNPRFAKFDILNALNDDLYDLGALGLYATKTVNITYVSPQTMYDLTGSGSQSVIDILEISWKPVDATKNWTRISNYELEQGLDTSEWTSGNAIHIYDWVIPGRTMRVRYKARFAPLVNLTDDVLSVSGLATACHDLPPMGAAIDLTIGREIKRNFTESQGDSRRAQEVPAGANLGAMKGLMMRRNARLQAELDNQDQTYPLFDRRH